MWPNKIQEKIESLDHKAHFYSGIANLIAYIFAFFGFLYGVAKWIEEYFPAFVKFAESHQWVVITLVGWFVATLVLLRQSYISKDLKNTLNRLGLICAENIKASGYSYSERRKIVDKYKGDFLSSRKLYLLGSTGYRTFSKINDDVESADNSALLRPIFDQIGNDRSKCSTVNIDILLLHPESTHINARVSDLPDKSTDLEKYVNEINYSIAQCKELKKKIPNLRCFYMIDH